VGRLTTSSGNSIQTRNIIICHIKSKHSHTFLIKQNEPPLIYVRIKCYHIFQCKDTSTHSLLLLLIRKDNRQTKLHVCEHPTEVCFCKINKCINNSVPAGAPTNIRYEFTLGVNQLDVMWDPPPVYQRNGEIIGYTAELTRLDGKRPPQERATETRTVSE
jgi:hypothetical protein